MTFPLLLALVAILAPGSPPLGQEPDEAPSCCAAASVETDGRCLACRPVGAPELPPLAADAGRKAHWLRDIAERARCGRHAYLSETLTDDLRALVARSVPQGEVSRWLGARASLAESLLQAGEVLEAIAWYEECRALLEGSPDASLANRVEVLYALGMAQLRLAEQRNCVAHHNAASCIFPLSEEAQHVDPVGARAAADTFAALLELEPDRREAAWLQNVAHMALGTWPDGVPEKHRFRPGAFASERAFPRFTDVAGGLGLDRHSRAGSALVEDLDGDGLLDLVTCSFDPSAPIRFTARRGDGSFVDRSAEAGLADQLGGSNVVQADVDGDVLLDLFVVRGGGLHAEGAMPPSLLVQTEPGRFRDATEEAGIELAEPSRAAAFADMDADGDLDLFVAHDAWPEASTGEVHWSSRLYRNDGAGRFEDVTERAGIRHEWACRSVLFDDLDGDGLPDLFLTVERSPNRLYVNLGEGRFREVAAERGVAEPRFSGVAASLDHDQDGDLDLLVTHDPHLQKARGVADYYWDGSILTGTMRLYENDGRGRFEDVTAASGLERVCYPLSVGVGDLDGDGYPDLYLGTGGHGMDALWPNLMLCNDGTGRFQDVTSAGGFGHLQKASAVVFADVDEDGDQDVFVQVGGFHRDDGFRDVLFANPGSENRWISVELRGRRSNRFGVGALLRARVRDAEGERDVHAVVGAGGSTGSGPLRAELGLGPALELSLLEVTWPGGAGVQRFDDVPLDARLRVTQDRDELERIEPSKSASEDRDEGGNG